MSTSTLWKAMAVSCICLGSAQAEPVTLPHTASYLTSDGAVAVIGNDGMETLIHQLNELYVRKHPGFRFAVTAKGSSIGLPALTAGAAAIAPLSREPWLGDLHGFKQVFGYLPTDVRIGYSGHGPRSNGKTPPAIYVHPDNPITQLSIEQLARVVTAGQPDGDINTWGQLGLTGEWADRRIHVYGLRDDGGFATNQRIDRFGGKPFASKYEPLADRNSVLAALSGDSHGIAVTGWVAGNKVAPLLKILPLSAKQGAQAYGPDLESVGAGHYPLSSYLHLYVNTKPGIRLEPFIKEYLAIALSDEGQALVRAQTASGEGYVPLSPSELKAERAKLGKL